MTDVVIAAATPRGHSALAVVRFSGNDVQTVIDTVVRPMAGTLPSGRARRVLLSDENGVFDDGIAVFGRGPDTYTGEDTLEVTCHGNPLIVDRLVAAAVGRGARLALPGEFTRRAVVHGKLDLVRAEAVDQISRAGSAAGLAIGRAGLDGRLGAFLARQRDPLLEVAAELEARLDYPADELAYQSDAGLVSTLESVGAACRALAETCASGRILVEGARVALVGPVNAGKSSLFNALLGRRRALVHDSPGTTRDVLEVRHDMGGLDITLLDTAGERPTTDPVEAAGLALARELVEEADLLVVVLRGRLDAVQSDILARTADRRRIVVYNGIDEGGAPPVGTLGTSAKTGAGLQALVAGIGETLLGVTTRAEGLTIASARQRELLLAVSGWVAEAVEALPAAGVAVAADAVTRAIEEIDALTGADTREDVLDALFARFCIGK